MFFRICSSISRVCLMTLLLIALGCGGPKSPLVKTYAAKCTVSYKDGQPLKGGMIEFRPMAGDGPAATGRISETDGSFSLRCFVDDKAQVDGALAGEYRVTVMPPQNQDQSAEAPVMLPQAYTIKADDTSNVFKITIEHGKRKG